VLHRQRETSTPSPFDVPKPASLQNVPSPKMASADLPTATYSAIPTAPSTREHAALRPAGVGILQLIVVLDARLAVQHLRPQHRLQHLEVMAVVVVHSEALLAIPMDRMAAAARAADGVE
jgi:hypothetical protein